MSASTIVVIAIVVGILLAFLMVVTTGRRRDERRATGRLSKETIERDRSEESAVAVLGGFDVAPRTGRNIICSPGPRVQAHRAGR